MNATKSWVCYLWLLSVESFERLLEFASAHNPISQMVMTFRDRVPHYERDSQSPVALHRSERLTTRF